MTKEPRPSAAPTAADFKKGDALAIDRPAGFFLSPAFRSPSCAALHTVSYSEPAVGPNICHVLYIDATNVDRATEGVAPVRARGPCMIACASLITRLRLAQELKLHRFAGNVGARPVQPHAMQADPTDWHANFIDPIVAIIVSN